MASPVADIVDAEVGVTAEQSRVQALFPDALANDDSLSMMTNRRI